MSWKEERLRTRGCEGEVKVLWDEDEEEGDDEGA